MGFLKLFNSFQIVSLFASYPFLLMWLSKATFYASTAAFWIAAVIYFIFFCLMVGAVIAAIDEW